MLSIDDLLGVRFKSHGRSIEEGFDCYGLAIEVSRRLGHKLDDLWYEKSCPETFAEKSAGVLEKLSDRIKETDKLELGNLVVFFDGNGNMVHIGVILDEDRFIHSDSGGVKVMNIHTYYRKDRKVYEWLQ